MKHLPILSILLLLSTSSKESLFKPDFNQVLSQIKANEEVLRRELIISTIIEIESENRHLIINNDMVGILQIRPIMVREVNDILGFEKFTLNDRFDSIKSIEMFKVFTNYHTPNWELNLVCRKWNGGENGHLKLETINYYNKVKKKLNN